MAQEAFGVLQTFQGCVYDVVLADLDSDGDLIVWFPAESVVAMGDLLLSESVPAVEDVSGYPTLLAELARRGYSRDDLARVAGLNVLRVMDEAERVSAALRAAETPLERHLDDPAPPQQPISSR